MRDTILIYHDDGASDVEILKREVQNYATPLRLNVAYTNASGILNGALNTRVRALFVPGGAARPYAAKLNGAGNTAIRNFVAKGGCYYGICAGAYYACRHTIFEQHIPSLCQSDTYGLDLMQTTAIGTLHKELGLAPFGKTVYSMGCVRLNGPHHQTYMAHYHGGPYFNISSADEVQVLASYQLPQRPAAVIKAAFGLGQVVLSGVHYETTGYDILKLTPSDVTQASYTKRLATGLIQTDILRRALFKKIMACCKDRTP
ncbi:MAG: BPL-N domain-containing protein [Alphaproteobacteria bacterium]